MKQTVDYYIRYAKEYHLQTFFIDPSSFLQPIREKLNPGAVVLDVGCGSGRDLLWFKKRGFRVLGFERSYPLARLARHLVSCDVIVGDFEYFDFSRFHVDALLLVGALVHLPQQKFQRVFGQILNAVNLDGYLLLSMKEGEGTSKDPFGRIFYYWSEEVLTKVLEFFDLHFIDVRKRISAKDPREVWLSFIVQKTKP